MSYPDNVMVMRLTSDSKKGKLSRIISLESLHTDKTITADSHTITMTGYPTPVSGDKRVCLEEWTEICAATGREE